ncbi:Uncharacterised protein [Actinobaculum suis]|uniref:N-acetyltransferase domain-containing protein n=1 Tax=Actinobaculum suis TaxID=1657 RepID=A0A7Z9C7L0_9ACTO|nr:GNAT family N-acetyltransferase [Actinobaculum suis]VDG75454.1 Uncharacterised protein [Actinobaculum suis]
MTDEKLTGFLSEKGLCLRLLDDEHMIDWFDCGRDEKMNSWLSRHARKWQAERLCQVWILSYSETPGDPIGFFTLSAHQVAPAFVPKGHRADAGENKSWVNNLDTAFPASLLGKFALAAHAQGKGLGNTLMLCVYAQHLRAAEYQGSKFLVLDVQNDSLAKYYQKRFGFMRQKGSKRMIKSTETILAELKAAL